MGLKAHLLSRAVVLRSSSCRDYRTNRLLKDGGKSAILRLGGLRMGRIR